MHLLNQTYSFQELVACLNLSLQDLGDNVRIYSAAMLETGNCFDLKLMYLTHSSICHHLLGMKQLHFL